MLKIKNSLILLLIKFFLFILLNTSCFHNAPWFLSILFSISRIMILGFGIQSWILINSIQSSCIMLIRCFMFFYSEIISISSPTAVNSPRFSKSIRIIIILQYWFMAGRLWLLFTFIISFLIWLKILFLLLWGRSCHLCIYRILFSLLHEFI